MNDVVIRRIETSDSPILRAIRLRALATDPASFGSAYERDAAFPDQTWVQRAERSSAGEDASTIIAIRGGEPVGIVTGLRDQTHRSLYHLVEMWVAPEARRAGLGRRLLDEIEGWITSCGATRARLSVTNAATAAIQLYESAGYKPDGYSEESRHTPGLIETSLVKRLDAT